MLDLEHIIAPYVSALMPPHARVVVAVSGGPDSQALLALLAQLRNTCGIATLWAVGVDHGLRPAAGAELTLAEDLAKQHGIAFHRLQITVNRRGNLLAQARRARYDALHAFAKSVHATHIAVAHTATDQAETVLMRLVRGSTLRGMGGIRAQNGMIVRPMLTITRQQIMAYITAQRIPFAQDPSNTDARRTRAHLRAHVLPALAHLNPRMEHAIVSFAQTAQDDDRWLTHHARRQWTLRRGPMGSLRMTGLHQLPAPLARRILRGWLKRHGLPTLQSGVETLLTHADHAVHHLSVSGRHIVIERGFMWVMPDDRHQHHAYAYPLTIPGTLTLPPWPLRLIGEHGCLPGPLTSVQQHTPASLAGPLPVHMFGSETQSIAFDLDHIHFGMEVRSWRQGDRFSPWGAAGRHMKVGDLFTNLKIPRALRAVWPVVVDGEDIVWVVGLRRSSVAPLTRTTQRWGVLRVEQSAWIEYFRGPG